MNKIIVTWKIMIMTKIEVILNYNITSLINFLTKFFFIMYFDLNINYDSSNKSLESYSDFCELISSALAGKI